MKKNVVHTVALLLVTFLSFAQHAPFEVKVTGKGSPIILIPGYSCSGEVWDETVAHLKDKYELHVLTLAGFGKAAPIASDEILKTVRDGIIAYVKTKKLQKPVLIGHSLGAFMTLWLESTAPDLFGKGICVDGLPFISAISDPTTTVATIKDDPRFNKQNVINKYKTLPNEGYVANMTRAMMFQVNDSVRARQIAEWSFQSDKATLGSTIVEMSLTDLRNDIAKIKSPILVLASTFGTKHKSFEIYNTQYKQLNNKIIKVADSNHFIMYDVPQWFYNEIDAFLNSKS